jgi:hypothetical protein
MRIAGVSSIEAIAWQQLKPFQDAARTWPIRHGLTDYSETHGPRMGNVCRVCPNDYNIWFDADPGGEPYKYTDEEITTLIVAHLRQCHSSAVAVGDPWEGKGDPYASNP